MISGVPISISPYICPEKESINYPAKGLMRALPGTKSATIVSQLMRVICKNRRKKTFVAPWFLFLFCL